MWNQTHQLYGWYAFDNDLSTAAAANRNYTGDPANFYVEYELPTEVYAFKVKYKITNWSNVSGTRGYIIQGYDNELNEWTNLTEQMSHTGAQSSYTVINRELDYSKAYSRFRLYFNEATGASTSGGACSGVNEFQLYGKRLN